LLLALAGGAAVAVFILVAAVHLGDNYHVDHVAGAWMGLAWYASDGVLYPALVEDGYFGGTRYMPLGIVLNAGAAEVSGEYLVSGKVLALAVMAALLTLVYLAARDVGCSPRAALGTVGAVIATLVALFAGTTIYGDALPVLLQLAALVVLGRSTGRRGAAGAGLLAALAFGAKLSGLWGLAAGLLWLLWRDRGRALPFAAAAGGTILVILILSYVASDGRFDENVLGLAGVRDKAPGELLADTPSKTFDLLLHNAAATLVLLPLALGALVFFGLRGQLQPLDLGLLLAGGITLVVMTDVGAGFNHLLDLTVLVPLVVARALAEAGDRPLRIVLAAAIVLGTAISLIDLRSDVREAASAAAHRETPKHLRAPALTQRLKRPVFSEDPSILIERGERPLVLDSYMLLRILEDDRKAESKLVSRFGRREFVTVVLIMDLDLDDPWWSESHLGIGVARAIKRDYRFVRKVPGPVFAYRLYAPRRTAP
jgi:hypothetical protein